MDQLFQFLSLQDSNVRYVVLGSIFLCIGSAVVGCFTFLRKRALIGDAVAHSVLPGVALAFMIFHTKHPLVLIGGALATGWLSLLFIDFVTRRSRIKPDAAIGFTLSVFFGIGILLLTIIQQSGDAGQSGLDRFLFGKAASLMYSDVVTFSIVSLVLVLVIIFFFREFTLISFDRNHAQALGLPVRMLEFLLSTLTVIAIATGIQAVGVVLMAALLISPAAAARYWTNNLVLMIILAALFGAFSGLAGSYVSYVAPSMPTGPWIVVALSAIAIFSLLLSTKRGMLARYISRHKNRLRITNENILKAYYHLGEKDGDFQKGRTVAQLLEQRTFRMKNLENGLHRLKQKNLLAKQNGTWSMTEEGIKEGQRITRLHRLWELYLTEHLRIAPDHVHEDAEAIEHIITPDIEARLEELLQYPSSDPHQTRIPSKT
ncbi:MAG: iron chelate uptake ABC transporter family permease subunit [Bacteroidia bacterium]